MKNSLGKIPFLNTRFQDEIINALDEWQNNNKVQRLWSSDATLWTNTDEAHWLGWLNSPELVLKNISHIEKLQQDVINDNIMHVVVLGMGGSSLCPDMMAKTFGKIGTYPELHVLDSTDPQQIRHLEEKLDLTKTLFIVSSKSGSTLEPNIFWLYFYARLQTVLNKQAIGDRFVAITDPGTTLESLAKQHDFKAIFYGIPSIGGRYSALSNFGMVPSALMGIPIKTLLHAALKMIDLCSPHVLPHDNPGVILGVILGICAHHHKDKITLIISPAIQSFGAWLEQLLAESTGKMSKGLIPVDNEPLGAPEVYGKDRVFVYIRLETAIDATQEKAIAALEAANHVVLRLSLSDKMDLGGEFFAGKWQQPSLVRCCKSIRLINRMLKIAKYAPFNSCTNLKKQTPSHNHYPFLQVMALNYLPIPIMQAILSSV